MQAELVLEQPVPPHQQEPQQLHQQVLPPLPGQWRLPERRATASWNPVRSGMQLHLRVPADRTDRRMTSSCHWRNGAG